MASSHSFSVMAAGLLPSKIDRRFCIVCDSLLPFGGVWFDGSANQSQWRVYEGGGVAVGGGGWRCVWQETSRAWSSGAAGADLEVSNVCAMVRVFPGTRVSTSATSLLCVGVRAAGGLVAMASNCCVSVLVLPLGLVCGRVAWRRAQTHATRRLWKGKCLTAGTSSFAGFPPAAFAVGLFGVAAGARSTRYVGCAHSIYIPQTKKTRRTVLLVTGLLVGILLLLGHLRGAHRALLRWGREALSTQR